VPASFVSQRFGQLEYFDRQLGRPAWRGKSVLDFGGNAGNLLRHARGRIAPSRYCAIDVSRDAVAAGRRTYPEATFLFYDRHHPTFNPGGIPELAPPDPGRRFDVVLAFSVFTHLGGDELRQLIPRLASFLVPGGVLAFTFFDPHHRPSPAGPEVNVLGWRLGAIGTPAAVRRHLERRARGARCCAVVDRRRLFRDEEPMPPWVAGRPVPYLTFFTSAYLAELFPGATITADPSGHHCCRLPRGAGGASVTLNPGGEAGMVRP